MRKYRLALLPCQLPAAIGSGKPDTQERGTAARPSPVFEEMNNNLPI